MTISISANYRALRPKEVARVAKECRDAWLDPEIPSRQFTMCIEPEMKSLRIGQWNPTFDALRLCLQQLSSTDLGIVLDVGASSGLYSEIIRLAGFSCSYKACDIAPAFKTLAQELYPGILFDIADATALPYRDASVDIVLNSACLMHIIDYQQAIREAARVSRRHVIFHRLPVVWAGPTRFYEKTGYGVQMLEIHFGPLELRELFADSNLSVVWESPNGDAANSGAAHRTYLLEKQSKPEPYASNPHV